MANENIKIMDKLKELLYRSFDEELSNEDQLFLDQALTENRELREEKVSIEKMHADLHSLEFSFEAGFSNRLMDQINEKGISVSRNLPIEFINVFKRIALVGAAAIIALLFTIYLNDGALNIDTIYGLAEYSTDEAELAYFNFQE